MLVTKRPMSPYRRYPLDPSRSEAGSLCKGVMRIEVIEVYGSFQLTGVQQPAGGWLVELVPVGGGKPFLSEVHADQHGAFAAARLTIDRVVRCCTPVSECCRP